MKETATKCRYFAGKTADDCPECVFLAKSSYCKYPLAVSASVEEPTTEIVEPRNPASLPGLESGPYRSGEEERFKQDVIRRWEARRGATWSFFCIESPGTADGFPDVLALSDLGKYGLYEFKVSDKRGVIRFQKTQPRFYRTHLGLDIWIVAWNVPLNREERIPAADIVAAKSLRFQLPR